MKNRKTRSFLYSLFLHGAIVLLVAALFMTTESDEKVAEEKRCKIMLTQVCEYPPEKAAPKPPVVQKQKKPQPKKQVVKKKPEPVKKTVVVKKAPVIEEMVVDKEVFVEEEMVEQKEVQVVEVEEEAKEVIVAPDAPVVLSPAAQQAIDAPPAENITPEDAYVKAHITEIMALLRKNLYYPRMARKRGIQGKVMVRFELMENGEIKNITVIEAGRDILASAAVTTIERLEGKFPLPSEPLLLNVPIMYQLR
ncbi:MAG: TonB family protein [Campylobacterota bacterium]